MTNVRAAAVLGGVGVPLAATLFVAACGARSGLFLDGVAASFDAAVLDDGAIPGLDAQPRNVVPLAVCADASDTLIYAVTEQSSLVKFNPSSAQFTEVGPLACPDPLQRAPFSMAVDRQGTAYVLYFQPVQGGVAAPGSIFKVDLTNASCQATSFVPGQQGFDGFGMGFVANDVGTGETLFVANSQTTPGRLGAIDEASLALSIVGQLSPGVLEAELTGTGDGRLFAFYNPSFDGGATVAGSAIGQIDKTTGKLVGQAALPTVTQGNGWAFAFWGGSFYTFTAPTGAGTLVQKYDPADNSVIEVATYPEIIDGAGVSTCAPVQ